ncbi:MAG: hypothetical protein RIS11_388, partial [Pseudomonadota bacterium]
GDVAAPFLVLPRKIAVALCKIGGALGNQSHRPNRLFNQRQVKRIVASRGWLYQANGIAGAQSRPCNTLCHNRRRCSCFEKWQGWGRNQRPQPCDQMATCWRQNFASTPRVNARPRGSATRGSQLLPAPVLLS